MRKLKALLAILSLLGIIIGCTEATTSEVISNDKKPEYKISFNANGGKGKMSDINIIAETSIILPENTFTRDNYTFMGWATTADGKVMFENGAIFEGLYSNVTLYAKWEKEVVPVVKITITFDVNGAGGTAPTAIETTSDKNVDLPALTNAKFSHWNTKADGSGQSYKGTAIFAESVTLYAILLAENAHTITYELDGGVNNTVNPFSFTEEDTVTLKNPTKDGYKFAGWYETADFSDSVVKGWFAGDKTVNVTLYAKWEKEVVPVVKITISFDVNGAGGTAPAVIETTPDENVELPVLTNAKFSHWNTSPDGSGQSYNGTATFTESVTLYAILLAENAHTITYELNGGVNHPKNKYSFTEDDVVILREPTRENCIFVGWYESPDFSGEKIELWYEGYKTANVTLYAKWIVGYTITYELNGGINDSSNLSFFTEDDYSIHVYAPTRDGYRFCGWYETEDFTDSSISYFYTSENLRNITLYAKWEQIIPGIYLSGLYDLNDSAHWAGDDNPGTAFAMTECENDVWTFTFTAASDMPFPYGFKFTTENGWQEQYQAYDKNNPTDDFAILQLDKEAGVYFATKAEVEARDEDGNSIIRDNATKFSLGVNNKFIVGGEYTITFDKANMKVKITGDFADIPTYTIEYVLTESWKSDFTPITKRCLGEEVELPTIENVDTEKDVASYILKWYTTETFETGTEIKKIYGDTEENMKLYGKIEEGYKTTADGFLKTIQSLTVGGPHNVIVTGELTSSQLSTIATYIKNYSTKKINLDLSETTGLTTINNNKFENCTGLVNIIIPESVTSINREAFYNCSSLTGITIPDSVTGISGDAFRGCSSLTTFNVSANNNYYCSSDDGKILYNKDKTTLLAYPSATGDVTISDGVTFIGSYAFYNCSSLTSVTIPDSVTSIGEYAFIYCSSLTSVTIPDSVIYIGREAFWSCDVLTSVTIPDGVTSIGEYAFKYCSSLTSVTIPDSVTSIGEGAFSDCDNLEITINTDDKYLYSEDGTTILLCDSSVTSVKIPENVASINYGAFACCRNVETIVTGDTLMSLSGLPITSALKSITIGNSVISIGERAFQDCSSLESVTIPDSVISIGNYAFSGCSSLTSVHITDLTAWMNIKFEDASSNPLYNVADLYLNDSLVTDLVIPDGVTSIGRYTFYGCSSLESVTIPDSVTSIGNYAFENCSSLESVYITDLTAWKNIEFENATSNPLYYGAKLYLNGSLAEFTVTFDAVGGSLAGEASQIVVFGEKVAEPTAPSKTGYVFYGWYTSAKTLSSTAYNFDTAVKEDITLYAKWMDSVVGYIAYSDGSISADYDSTKTAVGIVIEATDGTATKIVSLTQTSADWSTECDDTNATSETDGAANMTAIQSISGWEEKYPAFKWCDDYTDGANNSEWYLPAKDELEQLCSVKDYVNAAIDKITAGGGIATKLGTGWYWSSSETDYDVAWYQRFSDGNQVCHRYNKYDTNSVRAVRAF